MNSLSGHSLTMARQFTALLRLPLAAGRGAAALVTLTPEKAARELLTRCWRAIVLRWKGLLLSAAECAAQRRDHRWSQFPSRWPTIALSEGAHA